MLLGFVLCLAAAVQAPVPTGRTFEAASVKPTKVPDGVIIGPNELRGSRKGSDTPVPRNTGGPGTSDPGRIHFPLISLKELLQRGWPSYHDVEGPGWLETQVVAVDATMPAATTQEQFQEMLRNLVIERFGLRFHIDSRGINGYSLAVAKGGLKIKESEDQSDSKWARPNPPTRSDDEHFPVYEGSGHWMVSSQVRDRARIQGHQVTMPELARSLGNAMDATVTDATGLTKKYDLSVTYDHDSPQSLAAALQSQLGLKLDTEKLPVKVMVIDHMERVPSGN